VVMPTYFYATFQCHCHRPDDGFQLIVSLQMWKASLFKVWSRPSTWSSWTAASATSTATNARDSTSTIDCHCIRDFLSFLSPCCSSMCTFFMYSPKGVASFPDRGSYEYDQIRVS